MDLKYIDDLYLSQPMSEQERLDLLKRLKEISYLDGIDKGTVLEQDTILKIQSMREKRFRQEFHQLMEDCNDLINEGIRKNKRAKYKGRYHYPKKKIGIKRPSHRKTPPQVKFINPKLPDWLIS